MILKSISKYPCGLYFKREVKFNFFASLFAIGEIQANETSCPIHGKHCKEKREKR